MCLVSTLTNSAKETSTLWNTTKAHLTNPIISASAHQQRMIKQKRQRKALPFFAIIIVCFTFCRYVGYADSIYLPTANSIYSRFTRIRYDINPRSRSEHIELLMAHSCHQQYIERVSVYRKSALADLYRCVPAIEQVRYGVLFLRYDNSTCIFKFSIFTLISHWI